MHGVGNHTLPTMGDLLCDVTIAGKRYPIDMVVSTENEAIGCILGMDFLQTHSCELSLQQGYLFVAGMKIKLRRESATNTVARIKLMHDVTLPPRTELAVTGRPEHTAKKISSYYSVVKPSAAMYSMVHYKIMTGCAVVVTSSDNIAVPLMNTGEETRVLRKGTTIAVMRATAKISTQETTYDPLGLGRDRERKPVKSVPSPDNMRYNVKSASCNTTQERTDQYDHVAPLMTDISGDISPSERSALQDTLMEYADVFSSGPDDMGLTDRIEHTIDNR